MTNNEILSLVKAGFTAEQITKMIEREQPASTPAPETTPAPTPAPKPAPTPAPKPAPAPAPEPDTEPFKELVEEIKSLKAVMQLRNADEVSFLNPNKENKITTAGITADLIGGEF